jgi:hypothetical protein
LPYFLTNFIPNSGQLISGTDNRNKQATSIAFLNPVALAPKTNAPASKCQGAEIKHI